jgi:hypothetical protein
MNNINIDEAVLDNELNIQKMGLPKKNTFFTIDPYTSVEQYNEAIQALSNNNIKYTEFISLLGNYNWFLSLEDNQRPIMMNYDNLNNTEWTKLLSKTKPLRTNDIYLLYRRGDKSEIAKYVENDWLKEARRKKSIVFKVKNKEDFIQLSKVYGRIYPLGVYFNGSIKLAICFDTSIKNSLTQNRILLEMGPHKLGELELKINHKVLRNQDKIIKYTQTPYYENGKFYPTNPMSPLKIL